jgi:transcription antitermination factor NusG
MLEHPRSNSIRRWYALYTRSRHERTVEGQLCDKGIAHYLPLRKILRQWSDRKKWVEEPLFRCYIFIHGDESERYRALQSVGAVRIIGFGGKPAVVQDEEIERIKRILAEEPDAEACVIPEMGSEVEIIRGPLAGISGKLVEVQNEKRLIVMVQSIRQALRFKIESADVKVVG